jgi:hypothetical protein
MGMDTKAFPVRVEAAGRYALQFGFTNRSGPVNTGSLAAVRTVLVGGEPRGRVVFPQSGDGPPLRTAPLVLDLQPGDTITFDVDPSRTNMLGEAVDVDILAYWLTPLD